MLFSSHSSSWLLGNLHCRLRLPPPARKEAQETRASLLGGVRRSLRAPGRLLGRCRPESCFLKCWTHLPDLCGALIRWELRHVSVLRSSNVWEARRHTTASHHFLQRNLCSCRPPLCRSGLQKLALAIGSYLQTRRQVQEQAPLPEQAGRASQAAAGSPATSGAGLPSAQSPVLAAARSSSAALANRSSGVQPLPMQHEASSMAVPVSPALQPVSSPALPPAAGTPELEAAAALDAQPAPASPKKVTTGEPATAVVVAASPDSAVKRSSRQAFGVASPASAKRRAAPSYASPLRKCAGRARLPPKCDPAPICFNVLEAQST